MTVGTDGNAAFEGVTTVLLLVPDVQSRPVDACVRALQRVDEHIDRAAGMTIGRSASEWLGQWESTPVSATTPVTCIDVDEDTRSTASTPGDAPGATVERLSDPSDLEALGRRISNVLERANEAGDDVGVAVHSLTGILRHVDESTAFKFVYTLGEVTRRVDGVVFFHLDPDVHDQSSLETFRILCDEVVDCPGARTSAADR